MEERYALSSPSPPPFDEEDECRVCRGPAEEGYPLFSPCKCSGSIGLTHQDCLASWLEVQRLDGRCELCGTKFRFVPRYADGTPAQLPLSEVIIGLTRAAISRWLPWMMRMVTALGLWFLLVPLFTSYAYIGWLYGLTAIYRRLSWDMFLIDIISGAVIAAIVLVTFLTLMSFADFLRFNAQQGPRNRGNDEQGAEIPVQDRDIDDVVLDHHHIARRQRNLNAVGVMDQRQPVIAENRRFERVDDQEQNDTQIDRFMGGIPDDPNAQRVVLQRRIRAAAALQRHLDAIVDADLDEEDDDPQPAGPVALREDEERIADLFQAMEGLDDDDDEDFVIPRRQDNFEPQFEPINDAEDQDPIQEDADMNLALDELLGLRGPLNTLIRNILLFVAFVMIYLGIFAFVPRFVGLWLSNRLSRSVMAPFALFLNATGTEKDSVDILDLMGELNSESHRLDRALKLNDIFLILVGYIATAMSVVAIKMIISSRRTVEGIDELVVETNQNGERPGQRIGGVGMQQNNWDDPNNFDARDINDDAIEIRISLGQFLSMALDCSSSLVKVGSLLFLKMFLLPLILGIWLDVVTLRACDQSSSARILYAGSDLFSAVLVHWVIGITFMLLVTVSVLQLREVLHPGMLANAIRPQEPQPDLLGNLLNESAATHTKRMALSFGVYSALLMIYIWLPAKLLVHFGAEAYFPFFRPKFWYFMTPHFQVPLELLIFHISMLGFLEKYKNSIGWIQHKWLSLVCPSLGLTDYLLPRCVERYVCIGAKAIFIECDDFEADLLDDSSVSTPCLTKITSCASEELSREEAKHSGFFDRVRSNYRNVQVDPFWYELAKKQTGVDQFIEAHISPDSQFPRYESVSQTRNGKWSLDGCRDYIRVPLPLSEQDLVDRRRRRGESNMPEDVENKNLIPSRLGALRLRRSVSEDGAMVIEFWKECPGTLIQRPPEGWDDLGVGGAEIQGRWAWGKEKKSTIEERVAMRNFFLERGTPIITSAQLIIKLLLLLIISWVTIVASSVAGLSSPLLTGRLFLQLLRVSDAYIHDPLALAIGLMILSIIFAEATRQLVSNVFSSIFTTRFRSVPREKILIMTIALVVWIVVIPPCIGVLYDVLVIRSIDFFSSRVLSLTVIGIFRNWASGSILLNLWAYLCFHSVFTKKFWVNLGSRIFEADAENDGNPDAVDANSDESQRTSWQGSKNGRIARFFNVIVGALFCGQWDLVDREILFADCINRIAQMVGLTLCFPIVCCGASVAFLNLADHQQFAVEFSHGCLQGFCIGAVALQGCIIFSDELKEWLQVAHDTARDDRYLIGEILINYSPEKDL